MCDDACAICLDPIEERTRAMLACGHAFHVGCLVTQSQYDVRCAVCRQVDGTIRPRPAPEALHLQIFGTSVEMMGDDDEGVDGAALERMWRAYTARRRRLLRQRPDLAAKMARLQELRRDMRRAHAAMDAMITKKWKEIWRADPELLAARASARRSRRVELRLERQLDDAFADLIGPEPM